MNIIKPCFILLNLSYLSQLRRNFLVICEGVAPEMWLLSHVLLSEVLHASLCLLHLLWCHALEGFLSVSVHVDGELVYEVFGLYVGSIRLQDVSITTGVHALGVHWCHQGRHLHLVVRVKVLVVGALTLVIWFNLIFSI